MKCPSCGHFYDDKASDREGPECADCHEETMNEVKLSAGGGDRRGLARIYIYVGPDGYAIADRRVGPGERRVATFRMWLQRYSDTIWVKGSVVPDLILALRRPSPVGDTISREQAIAALLRSQFTHDDTYAYTVAALRSLPAIAPDPIEDEFVAAAVALAELDYDSKNSVRAVYGIDRLAAQHRFSAAKAARDGAR